MRYLVVGIATTLAGSASFATPSETLVRQEVAQPLDRLHSCLVRSSAAPVTGITPATSTRVFADGARIEQWFITSETHQRVTYALRAVDAGRTAVEIDLLQKHGQYARRGFADAARAALARCA